MLWNWHYKDDKMRVLYKDRAGSYANIDQGLTHDEMDKFYKVLGLRSLENPKGENVVHALKWSPVIATSVDQAAGHAMVVDGHAGRNYMVINPCAQMAITFDSDDNDSCTVGVIQLERTGFNRKLGKFIWYW